MADKKYPKRERYVTPRGTFKFPKLNEPDTKFKEEGEYVVQLLLPADSAEAKKLMKLADEGAAESLKDAQSKEKTAAKKKKWETKYLPYKMEEDDEGEETGNIEIKFSMKASGVSKKSGKKWNRRPDVFDAKGRPMKKVPNIGGGTVGKVSFEVIPYHPTTQVGASVKFALEGVQIIDLKSFGQRSASDLGFGEEEGYEYDEGAFDDTTEGDGESADTDGDEAGDEEEF